MFQIASNNPEYIKNLANKIISGEYKDIQFNFGIGFGKSSFMINLLNEINNQLQRKKIK